MSYLIDTNVICELIKPAPDDNVVRWFQSVDNDHLFLSVITLGEIRKGVDQLPSAAKKRKIQLWLENELTAWFDERILAIDEKVADCWGRLEAQCKRSMPAIDMLIAATAIHNDLALVTRNSKDFDVPNLRLINPFTV